MHGNLNKAFILGALGLGMAVFGVVRAGAVTSPGPSKVGYVDLQTTLNETKAGKTAKAKLETEKDAKQKEVNEKKEELKRHKAEFDRQKVVLKPEAVAEKQQEMDAKVYNLQQRFVELQQDLSKKEAALTKDIFLSASSIIQMIATRDHYTVILEKNESAVLWADPANNITAEVNKWMDDPEGFKKLVK